MLAGKDDLSAHEQTRQLDMRRPAELPDRAELRRSFIAEALAADAEFDRTGEGYEAEALFDYLEKKAAGKNPPHPKPVKWRK